MTRKINTFILITLFCCTLSSCLTLPVAPSRSEPEMPAAYTLDTSGIRPRNEWWRSNNNKELNHLIDLALEQNSDLAVYRARVRQAAATLKKTSAGRLPALTWSAGLQEQVSHSKTSHTAHAASSDSQTGSAGMTGSFDPDIWGGLAADQKSDVLAFEAAVEDLNEQAANLITDIITTCVDIIAARRKMAILKSQILTNEKLLELQKLRFVNGKSSALEVSQQKEALASAKAQVPPVKRQEKLLIHTLNALSGRFSLPDQFRFSTEFPEPVNLPESDVPATLLEKRPDIRAARLRLLSSDQQVLVARADLLPSLTLSASALFSSGKLDLLIENWILSLAASVTGPIFDAGKRQAEIDRTLAVTEEKLASYKKTVIQAFKEVEDTLVSLEQQKRYIHRLDEQLNASRITLEDARVQYINGKSNYLSYLTAWNGIQHLETQLISEKATLVKEKAELFRALGWGTPDMTLSEPPNHR